MADLLDSPVVWDEAELARREHLEFMKFMWPYNNPMLVGHHTREICSIIDKAIEDFKNGKSTFLAIKVPFRHGKALWDNDLVISPKGYIKHGDIKQGDYLYSPSGKPVRVLAVRDKINDLDNIVKFSDGQEIICHDHHEWPVYDRGKHRDRIVETKEMATKLYHKDGRPIFMVDSCSVLNYENGIIIQKKNRKRSIVSITKTKPVTGKCIQVEGGVYLVGETNIPTHNSEIVSRFLPVNFIGKFPEQEVIVAAYTSGLVRDFSRFARARMKDENYKFVYPGVQLSKESQSLEEWGIESVGNKANGSIHWCGMNGTITGKGGALIVFDDFFSGRLEAESPQIRDNAWVTLTDDILTRRAPVCITIILATPWHVDDPFGRIKKKMEEDPNFPRFREIKFPAFDDKYPEGILFPERFPKEWYISQKSILGPYGTASILQCDPTLKGGNQLRTDKIKIISPEEVPSGLIYTRGWDLASSEKQRMKDDPDYTSGLKLGVDWVDSGIKDEPIPVLYITDLIHGRWEAPRRNTIIRDTAIADGRITIGVESFGAYKDAYTTVRDVLSGIRVVKKVQLPGDKTAKYSVLEAAFEAGNVYLVRGDWNDKFIQEVGDAPNGTHDDIPDSLTVAYDCHSPNLRRVFPDFDNSHVLDYKIDFNHLSDYSTLIVSSWMDKNLETSFLMGLWSQNKSRLFIFAEYVAPNPYPQSTVINLTSIIRECSLNMKRNLKGFEWYGNSLMFSKKDNMQSEYRKRGVHIREAVNYNEYSSVSRVATLMKYSAVRVHPRCGELIRQIHSWTATDKPLNRAEEIDGFGLCRSFSLMASMIYETGKMRAPKKKIKPYSKDSQAYQNKLKTAMASGRLEEFSIGATQQSTDQDSWMGV